MFRRARWAWLLALAAGWLAATGPARALPPDAPDVTDGAGFFSPEAVRKAEEGIRQIRAEFHQSLVIETFKAVPEDRAKDVAGLPRRGREQFFEGWARERAQARNVDGVYVLMCRSPSFTQVVLGPGADENLFPAKDQDHLARLLAPRFARRRYDQELLGGVASVRYAMQANLAQAGRPAPSAIWAVSLGAIGGLLALCLLVLLVRGAIAFRRHRVAAGPGTASGSGAFVGGILGGTFGAQAGHWIWESLTRPRPDTPAGTPRQTPLTGRDGEEDTPDADDWPALPAEKGGALTSVEDYRPNGRRLDPGHTPDY